VPHLVPVNYPWVALYRDKQWVSVFPWIKDTQIQEGGNVYRYLPEAYDNGYKWVRAYLQRDPNIISLGKESDPAGILFPKFVEKSLRESHPGVRLTDIGMHSYNRRQYRLNWADFPRPFEVNAEMASVVESLGSNPNRFDVVEIKIQSRNNAAKVIQTGDIRTCDVGHRRLLVRFEKTGENLHALNLSLSPYRNGIAGTNDFQSEPALLSRQLKSLALDQTDDILDVTITNKRQRTLSAGFVQPQFWDAFLGLSYRRSYSTQLSIRKGDLRPPACIRAASRKR
jgi:hypothetical protein